MPLHAQVSYTLAQVPNSIVSHLTLSGGRCVGGPPCRTHPPKRCAFLPPEEVNQRCIAWWTDLWGVPLVDTHEPVPPVSVSLSLSLSGSWGLFRLQQAVTALMPRAKKNCTKQCPKGSLAVPLMPNKEKITKRKRITLVMINQGTLDWTIEIV